jgi:UDP-glucose 6-dehydrogenase
MTIIEEEIIDLLTQIDDINLAKELKHKITEYKNAEITRKVYEVFNHKNIERIRNSCSDAEVRRYVVNAYNKCR